MPRCCQQRPGPRTRRLQGVPFFVRAPQMYTTSEGSVGRSFAVPSGPYAGVGVVVEASRFVSRACAESGAGRRVRSSALRSKTAAGATGFVARPSMKHALATTAMSTSGTVNLLRRNRRSHASQKRLLVQTRQRARATRSPHSQQKFGLYIAHPSPSEGDGVHDAAHSRQQRIENEDGKEARPQVAGRARLSEEERAHPKRDAINLRRRELYARVSARVKWFDASCAKIR